MNNNKLIEAYIQMARDFFRAIHLSYVFQYRVKIRDGVIYKVKQN